MKVKADDLLSLESQESSGATSKDHGSRRFVFCVLLDHSIITCACVCMIYFQYLNTMQVFLILTLSQCRQYMGIMIT